MKLYLDNCCFNRPYDDQSQIRIRLEAEAKLDIQEKIRNGIYSLIWSYILDYENSKNPYQERSEQISKWCRYAIQNVIESQEILSTAAILKQKGIKKLDSLHIACAISVQSDYFLITDDNILKKASAMQEIYIIDPIQFIKEVSI